MQNAAQFLEKIRRDRVCYGTCITSLDPVLTEALSGLVDAVWIDAEHAPLPLESIQGLVIAAQGAGATALVRVPSNDPVLIKPVLDLGADGVIVPMVRSAADVRRAVAGCRYPPEGVRGFGPRRASRYGKYGTGAEYIRYANAHVITLVQIEHISAAEDIDAILEVEDLTGVVIGANDLSLSMGYGGEPNHPRVLEVIDEVLRAARRTDKLIGMATGGDPEAVMAWIEKGVRWMVMETETSLMLRAATELFTAVRQAESDLNSQRSTTIS